LIQQGEISHFRRASGWVQVGDGPVRRSSTTLYPGPEKRGDWRTHLE
jgi:hypothetical protein